LDKKIVGLVGAVAALGTLSSAQAAPLATPQDVLQASSYAELLEPIGNASEMLRAMDEQRSAGSDERFVQVVRYHHHHHHHHYRRHHHHHHHHHHH
jgi:hypothetical protein